MGIGHFGRELARAARALARRRGSTLAVVLVLTLGLGVNLAIFTVFQAVVLQPPPFPRGDRLAMVWETQASNSTRVVAPANFVDWRREQRSFEGLAALRFGRLGLTGEGPPQMLAAGFASGNLFTLLGARPAQGRLFELADEERPERLAVLSDSLWRRSFGARADVVGRSVRLGGDACRVVGVLPAGFELLRRADVWVVGPRGIPGGAPVPLGPPARDAHYLRVLGRLRDGVSLAAADAEMRALAAGLAAAYPDSNAGLGAHVTSLRATLAGDARPVLLAIQAGALLLLLVTLANVATLLLARATERARETAVRTALGASGGARLRTALAEGLLLGAAAAASAGFAAFAGVRWVVTLAPAGLPRVGEIALGTASGLAVAALAMVAAAVCTLAPLALRVVPAEALRGTAGAGGAVRAGRARAVLTVVEIALAETLVVGALLVGTSLTRLRNVETGVVREGLVVATLDLGGERGAPEARHRFFDRVLAELRAAPGVRGASLALTAPLAGSIDRGFWIEGRPRRGANQVEVAGFQTVDADHFATLGVPVLAGRAFAPADDRGPRVAIVSRALATRYFPEGALGRRLGVGREGDPDELRTIVGVVGDVHADGLAEPVAPAIYVPYAQNAEPWNFAALLVRAAGDADAAKATLRRAVLAADPDQPLTRVETLAEAAARELAPRQFAARLGGLFAGTALLLAALGTGALVAFDLARRRRELGIRAALGARGPALARCVLGRSLRLVAAGTLAGVLGALALRGLLRGLLYGVGPSDPRALALAGAVLAGAVGVVSLLPALRAARTDPAGALRGD